MQTKGETGASGLADEDKVVINLLLNISWLRLIFTLRKTDNGRACRVVHEQKVSQKRKQTQCRCGRKALAESHQVAGVDRLVDPLTAFKTQ